MPDPAPSAAASRFRPIRELARGGMGVVSLVFDEVRQEVVARKRILFAPDPDARVRFKREFRAVSELSHANLVRLHELGEDAHGLYFTMEAIDGVDLARYVRGEEGAASDAAREPETETPTALDPRSPVRVDDATWRDARAASTHRELAARVENDSPIGTGPVPGPPPLDLARLAHALPQVLEALAFVHGRGFVHRDLKPGNVLVTREGVVKLLDFGVLAEVGPSREPSAGGSGRGLPSPGSSPRPSELAGTAGFIAPEAIAGEAVGPAADLYALGCILFELAAGRPVFEGSPSLQLARHLEATPPDLAALAPSAPAALAAACAALLRKRPEERPSLADLGPLLLAPLGGRTPHLAPPRPLVPELFGREGLQRLLGGRLESGEARVVLSGPSGAGKSALLAWLAAEAERRGALVLSGRGRESERVPFNALDGAVDLLAQALARARPRRLGPEAARAVPVASRAFPVLAALEEGEAKPAPAPPASASRSARLEAASSRAAIFDAVAALLEEAARRSGGVLLLVDDLQWADRDSISLLDRLLDRAPAGVSVAATLRDDVTPGPASAWLAAREGLERISVPPLGAVDLRAIVARAAREARAALGGGAASEESERLLERCAGACAGRPFLAEVAGRALARAERAGLDREAETARIGDSEEGPAGPLGAAIDAALAEARGGPARALLGLLLAADGWTGAGDLASLVGRPRGAVDDALLVLERGGLVRRSGAGAADLYHDAVRAALAAALEEAEVRRAHGALAARLERDPAAPPHALVRHLLGAGEPAKAARHAREAARRAEAQHAYGLAAEMYGVALEGSAAEGSAPVEDRRLLLAARAEALVRAARYEDAAAAWRALAAASSGAEGADAVLREAHALLAAGRVEAGHARLDEGLRASGEPALGGGLLRGLVAGLLFLLGPLRAPRAVAGRSGLDAASPADLAPGTADPAERDVRVGMMVGYSDPLAGIRFLSRARRAFDRTGRPLAAAWCEYIFAYFAVFGSSGTGRVRLSDRWAASAAARLEGAPLPPGDPLSLFPGFLAGIDAIRGARWAEARETLDATLARIEAGGGRGSFPHLMAEIHRAEIAFFAEDAREAPRSLARVAAAAREGDATAIGSHVETLRVVLRCFEGRFAEATDAAAALERRFPERPRVIQAFFARILPLMPAAYASDAATIHEARRRAREALRGFRALRPLSNMFAGTFAALLALIEAAALRTGDRRASFRDVRRFAAIASAAPQFLAGGGRRALGYSWDQMGRRDLALATLAEAERVSLSHGQRIGAAIARWQRGRRLSGDEGAALVASARALIDEMGASPLLLDEDPGLRR